jgi:hypothetical protein
MESSDFRNAKPMPDKRFWPLLLAFDTAEPPVSPYLRNLYLEYAQRMGEKQALEMWHQLRAAQFKRNNLAAQYHGPEIQALTDALRQLDQTDRLLAQWQGTRDALSAAKPFDAPETSTAPKKAYLLWSLGEPMGMLFGILLCMSVGMVLGLVWSFLQSASQSGH